MKDDHYIESDVSSEFSGSRANDSNESINDANEFLRMVSGDTISLKIKGNPQNGEVLDMEIYDVIKRYVQEQKKFIHSEEKSSKDISKLKLPDTVISVLYLSSDSHKRILEKIERGKISGSIKKEWRRIRHRCFEEMVRHPIGDRSSSVKILLRKSVVPFLGEAYECLLKMGVGLALDFTKEDRAIQDLCDEFNDDKRKKPYTIRYEKFFGVRGDELSRRINGWHPRILHIAGHGTKKSLTFVNAIGEGVNVGVEKFLCVLNECTIQPDLVFLATCDSCDVANKVLTKTKVKATVGLKGQVKDSQMTIFTHWFYSGLMQGKRISEAIRLACQRSEISGNNVFVKCKNGADLPIVLLNDMKEKCAMIGKGNIVNRSYFYSSKDSPLTEIRINKRSVNSGDNVYRMQSDPLPNVRRYDKNPVRNSAVCTTSLEC